jgi:hypothetical protein
MGRVATVPAETDLLCETCGYVLNGLPPDTRCPECGNPTADSDPNLRRPTDWERAAGDGDDRPGKIAAFLVTSSRVLFEPTRFYRTLVTRQGAPAARSFARVHWAAASVLIGVAGAGHFFWFVLDRPIRVLPLLLLAAATYAFIAATTWLAARLTNWEATYRGLRLTTPVVRRGLYYHAVHYLPVALIAAATVVGYHVLLHRQALDLRSLPTYLYVLSGEVVLAAVYLFRTYWIGMRNMMYANR